MTFNDKSSSEYVAGIDGLRAIAVLSVIIFHFESSLLPGGFTGVDIFFVISGYVISKSLAKNYRENFFVFLLDFYRRRLLRILPALLACLLVTVVISSLFIPDSWLSSKNEITGISAFVGLSNFFLLSGVDGYFSDRVAFNPFVHTWSLAVEEQFYLVFPVMLYLWIKTSGEGSSNRGLSQGLVAGFALLSLIYSYFETSSNQQYAFYLLPSRFWELAAGAVLFQLHSNDLLVPKTKNYANLLSVSGLSLLALGFMFVEEGSFPFAWALVPVFGTALLIVSVLNTSDTLTTTNKILQSKTFVYIGKLSYSLYLWHWPVITMFRWTIGMSGLTHILLAAATTAALSVTSYHLVEIPVRRSVFLRKQASWTLVVGSMSVVLLAVAFTYQVFTNPEFFGQSTIHSDDNWNAWGIALDSEKEKKIPQDLSERTIFVVGDSHTGAYSGMLSIVSRNLGIKIDKRTLSGCPFVSLIRPYPDTEYCKNFVSKTLGTIRRKSKRGDIVFFASLRSYRLGNQWSQFDLATVQYARDSETAVRHRRDAIDQAGALVTQMQALGLHVLIDAPKPVFRAPPFRCADWFNSKNPICAPGFTISRDFLLRHNEPILESLVEMKEKYPFVEIWDPFPVLCSDDLCSAYDGDKPLFFDGDHLTGYGNRLLVPSFESTILRILDLD